MDALTILIFFLIGAIILVFLYTTAFILIFIVFYTKPLDALDEYTQNPLHRPDAEAKDKVDYLRYLSCFQYSLGFIWPKACKNFMKFSEHRNLTNAPVARWVKNMFMFYAYAIILGGVLIPAVYILIQMDGS